MQVEVLSVVFNLHRNDVNADQVTDDTYDSDLTKAAESAVERGVNEAAEPTERIDSDDFKVKPQDDQAKNRARRVAQKKKKQERQNRKKGRK